MAVIKANTEAADAIPEFWLMEAIGYLQANMGISSLVRRDAEDTVQNVGDTINVVKRGDLTVRQKAEGTGITSDNPSNTKVALVLDQHWYTSWTTEDTASAMAIDDALGYFQDGAMQLAEKIESTCFALYSDIANSVGSAGNDLTEDTILDARKTLNDQKAPVQGRNLIISSKDETALLKSDKLTDVDRAGTSAALRDAMLGRMYGFDVYMSQLVTEVAGTPVETHNLAFHGNAFMLAMRPLPLPEAGSGAVGAYIVDPESGLSLRYVRAYSASDMATIHTLDALWGVKSIDEDRLAVDVIS